MISDSFLSKLARDREFRSSGVIGRLG